MGLVFFVVSQLKNNTNNICKRKDPCLMLLTGWPSIYPVHSVFFNNLFCARCHFCTQHIKHLATFIFSFTFTQCVTQGPIREANPLELRGKGFSYRSIFQKKRSKGLAGKVGVLEKSHQGALLKPWSGQTVGIYLGVWERRHLPWVQERELVLALPMLVDVDLPPANLSAPRKRADS